MVELQIFFQDWGYLALVVLGFAEFVGVPIASVPFVIAGGALAASGEMSLLLTGLATASGGLLADLIWFRAARTRGKAIVDVACGLTPNPLACVVSVQKKVDRVGPRFIFLAKIIPGAANLIAPAAGLGEVRLGVFVAMDTAGLLVWSLGLASLGWVFHAQVERVIRLVAGYSAIATLAVAALMVVGAIWRVHKVRVHKGIHVREGRSR